MVGEAYAGGLTPIGLRSHWKGLFLVISWRVYTVSSTSYFYTPMHPNDTRVGPR